MPFNPALPANGTNASSTEMRAQLQSLHADIQARATSSALAAQIADTPHNCASVQTFAEQGITFADPESQQIANKLDELVSTLRRT